MLSQQPYNCQYYIPNLSTKKKSANNDVMGNSQHSYQPSLHKQVNPKERGGGNGPS